MTTSIWYVVLFFIKRFQIKTKHFFSNLGFKAFFQQKDIIAWNGCYSKTLQNQFQYIIYIGKLFDRRTCRISELVSWLNLQTDTTRLPLYLINSTEFYLNRNSKGGTGTENVDLDLAYPQTATGWMV